MVFGLVIALLVVAAGIFFLVHGKLAQSAGRGGRGGGLAPPWSAPRRRSRVISGFMCTALGTVTPLNVVSVNSRVEGQIVKISYQEGQFVKKGDPLLVIDPGPNQAALTAGPGTIGA